MGGHIAQVYMGLYPGRVAGFASIDSAPLKRSYYSRWELAALRHTKLLFLSIPWNTLVRLGSNGNAATRYGRDLMKTMMLDYRKREYCELSARGFRVLADAVEAQRPYRIDCPIRLICGEEDKARSAERYDREWARREGIPLHWIANAAHNSNCDAPDAVNKILEELLPLRETKGQKDTPNVSLSFVSPSRAR